MTQQEYEQKKHECFAQFCKDNGIDQEVNISIFDAFDQIFDRAYAFGKKIGNSDFSDAEDTVIQGWAVRDKDGTLNLFYGSDKPIKRGQDEYWSVVAGAVFEYLPREMFPDLTWSNDPIEVEIIIKRKKNGNNSTDNRI